MESKVTYEEIKEYVLEQSGLKVSSLYIAQVKRKFSLIEYENYNETRFESVKHLQCPLNKEKIIKETLEHFKTL